MIKRDFFIFVLAAFFCIWKIKRAEELDHKLNEELIKLGCGADDIDKLEEEIDADMQGDEPGDFKQDQDIFAHTKLKDTKFNRWLPRTSAN